ERAERGLRRVVAEVEQPRGGQQEEQRVDDHPATAHQVEEGEPHDLHGGLHAATPFVIRCATARSRRFSPVRSRIDWIVPLKRTVPSSRKRTSSASSSSSLMTCEVRITVAPRSRSARMRSLRRLLATGSRPALGSSSRRTAGSKRNVRTALAFCLVPPDSTRSDLERWGR